MKIKSTWGTFLFVIIAVTVVVCGNLFLINVGLKGKVDAPFKITADKNPTEKVQATTCKKSQNPKRKRQNAKSWHTDSSRQGNTTSDSTGVKPNL